MKKRNTRLEEGILFTDEYQLTMAQLYYRYGFHEKMVQFDYFFRDYPDYGTHRAGYCVFAGLEWLLDWMNASSFGADEKEALSNQKGRKGKPLFSKDFLEWLEKNGNFRGISIKSVPEGRVVHPIEPITVVTGPLAMAQILESSLLNHLNYQTLIATRAARIREAGQGGTVIEFGLRRGQSKGANAGARAALIGGADFTSNVGISHSLGYSPKGTHAHSMVQLFLSLGEGELGAFRAYADIYPDDCILLVDTVNTLESGIPNAIRVFEELKRKGHEPAGIRLDSGDLAHLSIQAASMLDKAGFPDTSIVLSNKLNELIIWQIITQLRQEAPHYGVDPDRLIKRLVYGVGTHLITSEGKAALDGVYKLVCVEKDGKWLPSMKLSETPDKALNPGSKKVWRIYDSRGKASADIIGMETEKLEEYDEIQLHHPFRQALSRKVGRAQIKRHELLLKEYLKEGVPVQTLPDIEQMRRNCRNDLELLYEGVRRIVNPHEYHVSLTDELWKLKHDIPVKGEWLKYHSI